MIYLQNERLKQWRMHVSNAANGDNFFLKVVMTREHNGETECKMNKVQ